MIKSGVIFDFNGVIVDDYPLQKNAWDKISLELRGRPVSDSEMLEKIRGIPTSETVLWMTDGNIDGEQLRRFAKKKEELIKHLYLTSPLYRLNKGLEVLLNQLKKKKIKMTISTSSNLEMARFSFEKLELGNWFVFDKMVYDNGKIEGKPSPGPYLLAAKILKLYPNKCIVFEDSQAGIVSAHKAGVGKIIVVGPDERLIKLKKLPGVSIAIHDFSEIKLKSILT